MSSGIALSGLASGLDTNAMVTQLMALEQAKLSKIEYRQDAASARKDGLNDVAGKLAAFKTAADALKSTVDGTWAQSQTVESSDASKVTASKISGTGIGGHTIRVDRLASSAQLGYKFAADKFSAGTLTVFSGADPNAVGVKSVTIDIKQDATLADVVTSINAASKSPVSAAVVNDADGKPRLVISSKTTGATGGFTVDTSQLGAAELTADTVYTRTGPSLDAQYELDGSGTILGSPSNTIENAIAGVRLTLKGVSSTPVTITASAPDVDRAAITTKIKALVDAYNVLQANLATKIADKPVLKPTSTLDAQRGALYGDNGLTSLASTLRGFMSQTLAGLTGVANLDDLGISVPKSTGGASTDDAKAGKLVIDDTKLAEALDADWTQVSGFFDAFAGQADTLVRSYTGTGKGILDGRLASADADVKSYNDQIDRMDLRLKDQETRLRSQFAAMETALSKAQSKSAWLAGQINSLGR
jgi:flagellar hook-associated protein 2